MQCEYIRTEAIPPQALTSTLFYLAEKGLLSLNQSGKKKVDRYQCGERGAWADLDPVSVAVGTALGLQRPGSTFSANGTVSSGKKLTRAKEDMNAAVKQWAFGEGLFVTRRRELWLRLANFVALVLAFGGFVRWFSPSRCGGCRLRCSSC